MRATVGYWAHPRRSSIRPMAERSSWWSRALDWVATRRGFVKAVQVAISSLGEYDLPAGPVRGVSEYLKAYAGWVYAAVKARAQDVSRIQLRLYRITNRKTGEAVEVNDHEVLSLLRQPNPLTTGAEYFEHTQAYKDLAGEAFWYLQKPESAKGRGLVKVAGMWMLRPDWITVNPAADGTVKDYTYQANGLSPITIPADQIIHHKEFNPTNPYRGMGVVEAIAWTIDQDQYAERYNTKFFKNNAAPGIVLSSENRLGDEVIKRMRTQWNAEFGGPDKAHKLAILEGGLKITPFAMSQKDMEFLAGQGFTRDKILAAFQTPKTILGMTEAVTVSNADATDRIFAKRVVKPAMQRIVDVLNEKLLPLYGEDLFFEFDDPTPEDRITQVDAWTKLAGIGVYSINEIRAMEGHEPIEGGDRHYIPFSVVPVDGVPADEEGEETPPNAAAAGNDETEPEAKTIIRRRPQTLATRVRGQIAEAASKDVAKLVLEGLAKQGKAWERTRKANTLPKSTLTDEQQDAIWRALITHTDAAEARYKDAIRDAFTRQERDILKKLDATEKAIVNKLGASQVDGILFDVNTETKVVAEVVVPLITDVMAEVGDEVLSSLGLKEQVFNIQSETMKEFLRTRAVKGIRAMNKLTRANVRQVLVEGVREGLGIPEISRGIRGVFEEADKVRADRIARTEVLKASNRATLEAYKQSKVVVGKQWYTALDERVCEWCGPMHGVVLGLDDDFFDEGTTFTGQQGNPLKVDFGAVETPPLHPNCRCTLIPITISAQQ